jgi:hypothetical protein
LIRRRRLLSLRAYTPDDLWLKLSYPFLQADRIQLVVYPGEVHRIKRPSFNRHRLERYLQWYDHWIKGSPWPAR